MNRRGHQNKAARLRIPRTRGDEPYMACDNINAAVVFPAPAGMNRRGHQNKAARLRIPRTRGDEPYLIIPFDGGDPYSPHPRG
ncbi:uncharacterized protein MrH_2984 [Meiothermus ruber H328]|nr:uncharacterized protein MrH_2984 [Meiothermus ruber H328]